MNTGLFGVLLIFFLTILLAIPFGKYIAAVFSDRKTILDPIFNPLERIFFRISRIRNTEEMSWKDSMIALLVINFTWFLLGMLVLMNQGWLPLNPDGNASMTADLAFNTSCSFVSNTNLQHYSGETGLSYLGQLTLQLFQFISAGTGIAAAAIVFFALKERTTDKLGNFYHLLVRSCTRILLPVAFIGAVLLIFNGTPQTFHGKDMMITMQGDTVAVSGGPAAGMIAIKQAGTNGGGYFGINSAHPFENPNYFTNIVENILILLIPMALVFALGYFLRRKRFAWIVFAVMTLGFVIIGAVSMYVEVQGNPAIAEMGIDQPQGSMEGKEVRFGSLASAFWGISTTSTSNGSVNSMHDSHTAISGAMQMLDMMMNVQYGGVGVGFLNIFIFIILAVFIAGLMVGRTPEFFGKKIEAREVKIAMIVALLHPMMVLSGTALASYLAATDASMGWWWMNGDVSMAASAWLNNPSYHGFSEMLYEFTSASANNGSGFEGLGDNNRFWNITTGLVMLLSRYIPIIGPVAIAGLLAGKRFIPPSNGMLKTDSVTFGLVLFAVIVILVALAFFPALALGPLAENFSM